MSDTAIVPEAPILIPVELIDRIAGQLAPSSQRIYTRGMQTFHQWMVVMEQKPLLEMTVREAQRMLPAYRQYIMEHYAKGATAQRLFSTAMRVVDAAYQNGLFLREEDSDHVAPGNPAHTVRGITADNATPAPALDESDARLYLGQFDRTTLRGLVEYTMAATLLYTGLRRSELVALNLSDLTTEQGHSVLIVREGKGQKRRVVKVKPELRRWLDAYLEQLGQEADYRKRYQVSPPDTIPLFVTIQREPYRFARTTDKTVYRIIKRTTTRAQVKPVSPHGLRATFATKALRHTHLHKVQHALGHADPRTTERYNRERQYLDDNAVDVVSF